MGSKPHITYTLIGKPVQLIMSCGGMPVVLNTSREEFERVTNWLEDKLAEKWEKLIYGE